ncbi:hypothetical protein BU14_0118s0014 [Porphyra umbilicalis]|uniref:Uncharacterized protein n=1 Tax=Porphyra umbilicalis TaxID=2786 RepID=A0A1X6PBX8_PORUM|nr:hypothetical protein BU14_0118s0014 [Porphyra umbilicalis]|eukprot:OSX78163.1 hypothetical protein BU14_0118s0014 [Porphyra umbilicalis]
MDGGHRTRFAGATPAAGATLFDSVTGEEGLYVSQTPAIGVMYDTFVGFDPSRPGKRLSATKRVDEHGVAHFVSAPRSVQRKGLHATARGWTPRPSEYNTVVAAAAELAADNDAVAVATAELATDWTESSSSSRSSTPLSAAPILFPPSPPPTRPSGQAGASPASLCPAAMALPDLSPTDVPTTAPSGGRRARLDFGAIPPPGTGDGGRVGGPLSPVYFPPSPPPTRLVDPMGSSPASSDSCVTLGLPALPPTDVPTTAPADGRRLVLDFGAVPPPRAAGDGHPCGPASGGVAAPSMARVPEVPHWAPSRPPLSLGDRNGAGGGRVDHGPVSLPEAATPPDDWRQHWQRLSAGLPHLHVHHGGGSGGDGGGDAYGSHYTGALTHGHSQDFGALVVGTPGMGGHPGTSAPPSVFGVGGYRVIEADVYVASAGYAQSSVSVSGGGGAPNVHVRVEVTASPPGQPALERRSSMPYYRAEQQPLVQPALQRHPSGSLSSSDAAFLSLIRKPGVGGIGCVMGRR